MVAGMWENFKKHRFYRYLEFALRGAYASRNGTCAQAVAGVALLDLFPKVFIAMNTLSAAFQNAAVGFLCVALVFSAVFFARLIWAPFHFKLEPDGGLYRIMERKFGWQLLSTFLVMAATILVVAVLCCRTILYVAGVRSEIQDLKTRTTSITGEATAGNIAAKLLVLENDYQQYRNYGGAYDNIYQGYIKFLYNRGTFSKDNNQEFSTVMLSRYAEKISALLQADFNISVDLYAFSYDPGNYPEAPNAKDISDEAQRYKYSEEFYHHQINMTCINGYKNKYQQYIDFLNAQLSDLTKGMHYNLPN